MFSDAEQRYSQMDVKSWFTRWLLGPKGTTDGLHLPPGRDWIPQLSYRESGPLGESLNSRNMNTEAALLLPTHGGGGILTLSPLAPPGGKPAPVEAPRPLAPARCSVWFPVSRYLRSDFTHSLCASLLSCSATPAGPKPQPNIRWRV